MKEENLNKTMLKFLREILFTMIYQWQIILKLELLFIQLNTQDL